jgi:hypothetical protein
LKENQIKKILAAHHPPLDQKDSMKVINDTRILFIEVEESLIEAANGIEFPNCGKTSAVK